MDRYGSQTTLDSFLTAKAREPLSHAEGGVSGETDPEEFAKVLLRCHEMVTSCTGLDVREGLYELFKLLLVKMREEGSGGVLTFGSVGPALEGAKAQGLFCSEEAVRLDSSTLREVLKLLRGYRLSGVRKGALGAGLESFLRRVGRSLGAFLTPREIVEFMVGLADPKVGETVLDPACGAGYFLMWSLLHMEKGGDAEELGNRLWGIDIDPFFARLSRINLKLLGADARIFRANSLDLIEDPVREEHEPVRSALKEVLDRGGFDVILANPPFGRGRGSLVTDRRILEKYENGRGRRSQVPEILFVELCVRLLRPSGRAVLVVPRGILNNRGRDYVALRKYVMRECLLKAVVDLPAGAFRQYGTDAMASVLFVQKKRSPEEEQGPIFMAIATHVGYDTCSERYRRTPQNDLPVILNEYRETMKGGGAEGDSRASTA
jgi:SAM-dependent methyltransferase